MPAPVANFTGSPTSGEWPLTVQFTDSSTNTPTSWDWDFGDGSPHDTTQNPQHIYSTMGRYTVKLIATNGGGSNTKTRSNYINAVAQRSGFPNQIQVTLGSFFNGSAAMSGLNSGDVLVLTKFTIGALSYWSENGTNISNGTTNRIRFHTSTTALGNAQPTISGFDGVGNWGIVSGQGFQCQNCIFAVGSVYNFKEVWSNNTVSFSMQRGNGTGVSIFNGKYNPNVFSSISEYIPAPVTDFSADVTSGTAPLTVQFTDTSINTPTSWDWDFGDSTTHGTTQNPSHTYSTAGTYTVILIATNSGGADTETKTDYITVSSATRPTRETSDNSPSNTIGMPGTDDETPGNKTGDTKLGNGISGDVLNRNKIRLLGIILSNEQSGSADGDKVDNSAGVNHGRGVFQSQGFAGMNVPYQP